MTELTGILNQIGSESHIKENHHSQLVPLGEALSPRLENAICHSLQDHTTNANKDLKKTWQKL